MAIINKLVFLSKKSEFLKNGVKNKKGKWEKEIKGKWGKSKRIKKKWNKK